MKIRNLNIELTTKCPLRCPQCYCSLEGGKEISLTNVEYWLKEAKKVGIESIYLSGGETLCHSQIEKIIELSGKVCDDVEIAISGVYFNKERLLRLINAGIKKISVSLNGSSNEINSLTREGFEYAINALIVMKENGFNNAIINWVMHSNNCDDFRNIIRIAEKYNVSEIIILSYKPNLHNTLQTVPSFKQMKDIVEVIKKYNGVVKISIESCYSSLLAVYSDTPVFGNINISKNKGCLAGIDRISVDVDGKLSPCRHLDYHEDYDTIEEYWNNSPILNEIKILHRRKDSNCQQCKYNKYCRPCLAVDNKLLGKLHNSNSQCPIYKN